MKKLYTPKKRITAKMSHDNERIAVHTQKKMVKPPVHDGISNALVEGLILEISKYHETIVL